MQIKKLPLARLLDTEDPELCRALSRLVGLLTPSMAAEEESLARRKQELLLNNVGWGGIYYVDDVNMALYRVIFLTDPPPKSSKCQPVSNCMRCLQVLRRLLNLGCAGAELWSLYQTAVTCRHHLSTEVILLNNSNEI